MRSIKIKRMGPLGVPCWNIRDGVWRLIRMNAEIMDDAEFVGEVAYDQIRADLGHDDEGGRIGMLFDRAIMK